jgi:hypothetical protein
VASAKRRGDAKRSSTGAKPRSGSHTSARAPAVRRGTRLTKKTFLASDVLTKRDAIGAAVVGGIACVLFVVTFSPHVAQGDAPESVAGVRSLGILHAPGYPAYVLLGHAFGSIVSIGGWAFRVNLFSLVCATLLVAVVYLLARSFGASIVGSAIGALALATSASFWFNAGFAKHYALSGLLVTTSALVVMFWIQHGRTFLLVSASVFLGVALGAAWELAALMGVGLVVLIAYGPRRPTIRASVAAGAVLFGVAFALSAFVLLRARQDPTLNWGDATTIRRFMALVTQRDFRYSGRSTGQDGPLRRMLSNLGILIRDLGLGAFALAAVGAVASYRALAKARALFLAVVGVSSLLAVTLVAGKPSIGGFFAVIQMGGFFLDTLVVLAVLAALGATWAVSEVPNLIRGTGVRSDAGRDPLRVAVVAALAMIALLPSVLVHHQYADHRLPPLADRYATQVFALLPPHSALITWGEEFSWPLVYRQVVDHDRPDVAIISANSIPIGWASDELTRRYHLGDALRPAPVGIMLHRLIDKLAETRRVYVDTVGMVSLKQVIGYRSEGLVAEVTDGTGPQGETNLAAIATRLEQSDRAAGVITPKLGFANRAVNYFYERAHIELAKQYCFASDYAAAVDQLGRALQLFPDDNVTAQAYKQAYEFLRSHDDQDVEKVVVGL